MAYGLGTHAPAARALPANGREPKLGRRWTKLSEAVRLELVERALTPERLLADGFPAAL